MYWYGVSFMPVNFLFLCLGILLLLLGPQMGLSIPEGGDDILPFFAANGYLGFSVLVCFTIGIIAAAFSSADSALTALTTSFCVDILDNSKLPKEQAERQRKKVHFYISVVFILCILVFRLLNNKSVIDALYVMASYTYGPLLGLFIFGLFTKWQVRDHLVPYIAIASPFICYLIQYLTSRFFGYQFGYELLMFNGLLTIIGLYCISLKKKDHGNTYG